MTRVKKGKNTREEKKEEKTLGCPPGHIAAGDGPEAPLPAGASTEWCPVHNGDGGGKSL